jgi:hypothetical protein
MVLTDNFKLLPSHIQNYIIFTGDPVVVERTEPMKPEHSANT